MKEEITQIEQKGQEIDKEAEKEELREDPPIIWRRPKPDDKPSIDFSSEDEPVKEDSNPYSQEEEPESELDDPEELAPVLEPMLGSVLNSTSSKEDEVEPKR